MSESLSTELWLSGTWKACARCIPIIIHLCFYCLSILCCSILPRHTLCCSAALRQLYKFLIFRSYCVIHMEISAPISSSTNHASEADLTCRKGTSQSSFICVKCQLCGNVKTISLIPLIERLNIFPNEFLLAHHLKAFFVFLSAAG